MKTLPLFGQIPEPTGVRYVPAQGLDMFQPLLESIRIRIEV